MENNSKGIHNITVFAIEDEASPIFAGFCMIISGWIIVLNSFVILTFLKDKKHHVNNTFTFQLLTLSLSDVLVGVATLPVYATVFTSGFYYEDCLCRLAFLLSAHAVEQFHIFGICVNRVTVIYQLTTPHKTSSKKLLVVVYLLLNWILFLTIYSVAFRIWGRYSPILSACSLNEMFKENYKTYVTYTLSFFIIPSVLINVIYGALILKLEITTHNQAMCELELNSRRNSIASTRRNSEPRKNSAPAIQPRSQNSAASDGIQPYVKEDTMKFTDKQTSSQFRRTISKLKHKRQEGTAIDVTIIPERIPLETRSLGDDVNVSVRQHNTTNERKPSKAWSLELNNANRCDSATNATIMRNRRALNTMGLVLLCYDISVLPFIILFFVEVKVDYEMSRDLKLMTMVIMTMNSVFNPFIYIWKCQSLRKSIKERLHL